MILELLADDKVISPTEWIRAYVWFLMFSLPFYTFGF